MIISDVIRKIIIMVSIYKFKIIFFELLINDRVIYKIHENGPYENVR